MPYRHYQKAAIIVQQNRLFWRYDSWTVCLTIASNTIEMVNQATAVHDGHPHHQQHAECWSSRSHISPEAIQKHSCQASLSPIFLVSFVCAVRVWMPKVSQSHLFVEKWTSLHCQKHVSLGYQWQFVPWQQEHRWQWQINYHKNRLESDVGHLRVPKFCSPWAYFSFQIIWKSGVSATETMG